MTNLEFKQKIEKLLAKAIKQYENHSTLENFEHAEDFDNGSIYAYQQVLKLLKKMMAVPKIKIRQSLSIPLSSNDLDDLMSNEEFNWTFPTNLGEDIDIHLYHDDFEMDEDEENKE